MEKKIANINPFHPGSTPSSHLVLVNIFVFTEDADEEGGFVWSLDNRDIVEDDSRVFIGF